MQKYVVGWDIADVRNLKPEGEGTCDPFVVVQCCGKSFRTAVKENKRLHVPINESQIWNDIELNPEKFETAYIEFSVYARNFWWRDYLIGKASLQLSSINRRKGHLYSNKTVPLRKENDPDSTGSITLTVWCLVPGESAPATSRMAAADEGEDGKEEFDVDLQKAVLGDKDAQQPGARYHLIVNIFRVEDLAKVKGSLPSPFVTVEFAGACQSTDDAHNTAQYTFNNEIRIPVQAPICEDVVLIKLWTKGSFLTLTPDLLLAQGLISFSELRNNALPPRWFCLYGWDTEEVDMETITRRGERILPNSFKGKLLISGRVERIKDDEEMKDANKGRAQQPVEPEMRPVALLADVYQVCGAVGKECQVRLAFGAQERRTQEWVPASRNKPEPAFQQLFNNKALEDADAHVDTSKAQVEDMVTFQFTSKQGRIDALIDMTPEDHNSQPYIMVNVYTRGIMSGELRVGYQMRKLADFTQYEPGSPSKPRFIPLEAMPNPTSMKSRVTASVLMVIEHYVTDDVQRHDRKNVKPMSYIVRAYVFMARNIVMVDGRDKSFAMRVTCAGVSKNTAAINEVRPMWMKCVELPIILCSDHPKEQPTMFPITCTLCHQSPSLAMTRDDDIGKAVCVYEHMRRKDNMDRWEPFQLRPQWVQLKGGEYGSKVRGEVLVAFELLHAKDRACPECKPKPMWPAESESDFDDQEHFSYLRKATLHMAMFGVRDLKLKKTPGTMEPEKDMAPMVQVRIKKFEKDKAVQATLPEPTKPAHEDDEDDNQKVVVPAHLMDIDEDSDKFYSMGFKYAQAVDGGDKDNKDDRLMYWYSDALGACNNLNYEIFQTKKKKVLLPDKVLLQPFISIRVLERPSTFSEYKTTKSWLTGKFEKDDWVLIGEYRQSLSELYPCKWLHELYNNTEEAPSEEMIMAAVDACRGELKAKAVFEEETPEQRAEAIRREREKLFLKERDKIASRNARLIEPESKVPEAVDTAAWPLALRMARDLKTRERAIPLTAKNLHVLNMHRGGNFRPRFGEKHYKKDRTQAAVSGKLEARRNKARNSGFQPDFYFQNLPLLKGHDLIDPDADDDIDWNYYEEDCFGFVKCTFKISDGWGDEEDARGAEEEALREAAREAEQAVEDAARAEEEKQREEGAGEGEEGKEGKGGWALHHLHHAATGLANVAQAALGGEGQHDMTQEERDKVEEAKEAAVAAKKRQMEEMKRLNSSYGLSEELESFAYAEDDKDKKKFAKRFKGQDNLPSRIRVRIYFVKAICIMGKPGGQDPYLRFKLGKAFDVSMRNMFQPKTSTPSFYRVEERDIRIPEDGRLQVDLYDYEDAQDMVGPIGNTVFPEKLIGSTIIDLEDRWHSQEWRQCVRRKAIPPEQRPLYHPEFVGQNCGSIEMWVEMLDSIKASEEKAADLRKPPEEQVEVRIVIWTCSEVPLLNGSGSDAYTDVSVTTKLECNQYRGEDMRFPKEQQTDIHNHCTSGNAVFNWRIVFPRITVPTESCTVDITLKDTKALSEVAVGQVTLDIRKYVEKVGRDMESVRSKADLKFLPIDADDEKDKKKEDEAGPGQTAGRVQLEMWVLTQEEAIAKEAGMGRNPPNDHPPLTTPAEGRGWGDVFAGMAFELPNMGLFWKVVPLILFTLVCLVGLRYFGLL